MSTSPIGTVFPAVAPSALVKVGIPTGDGFSMLDGSVPVESLTGGVRRFDVTFPASEFKNIGTTPLVIIESNRTVIVTSAAVVLSEQTEAFDFGIGISITTSTGFFPQLYTDVIFSEINSNGLMYVGGGIEGSINIGNVYVASKSGEDATTGDGFVRITGLYYEIDL